MKKSSFIAVLYFIFSLSIVFGQDGLYYYGYQTKYPLTTDSIHAILIPILSEEFDEGLRGLTSDTRITNVTPIANRREILVTLNDSALLNEQVPVNDYEILPVYYIGTRPLRPTGEIILRPKDGVSYSRIKEFIGDRIQHLRSKKHGVHVVKPEKPWELLEIANQIFESGLVEWCEPNFLVEIERQLAVNPTDPLYPQQYYLNQANNIDIDAPQAWGISMGLCPVRVAVIDDGVETHEDLDGRVVAGFTPLNPTGFGAPVVNLPPANEGIIGHGQACAGIIGASHNILGVAGILPNAEIVPVNIFHSWILNPLFPVGQRLVWLETAENIADAIDWAWDEGEVEVINNS